jgi:Major Facilitator Superfamily
MTGPVGDGSAAQLRRAKASVTAAFMAHAVLFSSWAAHIPQIKAGLGLSDGALGTALFGAPLGCVVATILSHWTLPRWGSRRLVGVTIAGYAAAGVTIGLAGSFWALFAALTLWGLFQGGLDVAMNTQAAAVERLAKSPIMARFHGMWSVGALLGAMTGTACVSAGVGLTTQLVVTGVVVLIVGKALSRNLVPDLLPEEHAPSGGPNGGWLTSGVAALGVVVFASFLCEGAAADWSAIYLRNVAGTGPGVSGLGYAGFTLLMVVTRMGAIGLHSRIPSRRLLPALALFGTLGMVMMLSTPNPVAGVVGLAALGAGVALLVPTSFSAAFSVSSAGSAIAIVAAIGWLGCLLGPPLIGLAADVVGLRNALFIVPVMLSIAGITARCTAAFEAADQFHQVK